MNSNNSFFIDNLCSGRTSPGGNGGDDDDFTLCVAGMLALVIVIVLWLVFNGVHNMSSGLDDQGEQNIVQHDDTNLEIK